ncbi:MAG TPA: glycosyltransferase family 2 protein [Candidatus Sulfotelmatobacter sp.]|nr:glycosyltransferase family 2 protein [Candidatus Sulfotelmatobacter sp.]
MAIESVCAVVVTGPYEPSGSLAANIAALRPQIDRLVIVNNGSGPEYLAAIDQIARTFACDVILNERNLGIAFALNKGVEFARSNGCRWVVLFDQDSTVKPDYISSMLRAYREAPAQHAVGILSPRYIDRFFSFPMEPLKDRAGRVLAAMTSGSMMPIELFDRCGMFEESLFLDYVDNEFCLRIRQAGFSILEVERAELLHSLGRTTARKFFAWKIVATNHSAVRRYYITRNRVWLYRRYYRKDFAWFWRDARSMTEELVKILVVEDRVADKLWHIALGIKDAIRGRMGSRGLL